MPASTITLADLAAITGPTAPPGSDSRGAVLPAAATSRDVSIWEITTWILPMTPEHLRRVLGQTPALPQGRAGTDGGTRWFTLTEVEILRQHFTRVAARHTGRGKLHGPLRPAGARAPLIAVAGPLGRTGRSSTVLHLACAAALAGYKVLVLDADPAGRLATQLGATRGSTRGTTRGAGLTPGADPTVLPLIARSCGVHLRQINVGRMDRGEPPLPMDEAIATALEQDVTALIRPTAWPGLDVIAAAPDLLLADSQMAAWRSTSRSWHPAKALATALDREGLRDRYDLILCDTGRGLGPLVLSVLTSADVLLIPRATADAVRQDGTQRNDGLAPLARTLQLQEAEAAMTARALGQPAVPFGWRRSVVLPIRSAPETGAIAGDQLGLAVLPHPLPYVPQVANGQAAHLYALDYRDTGRLIYAPLRDACDAAWRGVAAVLAGLWAEDAASSESELPA